MISWAAARCTAWTAAPSLPAVDVDVCRALGLVLAEPLTALAPLPSFDTAAMDGWAVRGPGPWTVSGRTLAGDPPPPPLVEGRAREVATGAQVPAGCDGVVPREEGALLGDELTAAVPAGRHVRRTGEECAADAPVLPAGTLLSPAGLGLAAAVGHDVLRVRPRPTVSALVTGDELLVHGLPGGGRVRDAVGPLLPGAVARAGGLLLGVRRVGDRREELVEAVRSAPGQVVLTSGASSAGHADHLAGALADLGAEVLVDGVGVRPGHPQTLARLPDGRLLAGLPGNPLAALSALATVVAPLLAGLQGQPLPALGSALLTCPVGGAPAGTRLVPVQVSGGLARPTGHAGAAMLRGAALADAFAVVDHDRSTGDRVPLVPLG